ncbi:MAG: DUF3262 family protein [[Actinobacillus] rossii]|uniref:DUF3262 family protein n=1 Tax=Pasteurella multocida TaxID=747 RepID=UPI00297A3689|nr:DUF3262 family protein [[Actinobacillus] rossii]MDD7426404.1 DUF3262 family protein [[Actinobacillus] rossii]MDY3123836.1 DUF3262 family protein [[Actinobacillus] rossii]MDY4506307.1 DUF3262 family protein [[Actinobacillus] rossii]
MANSTQDVAKAFEVAAGSNSAPAEFYGFVAPIFFAILLVVIAYILLQGFDEFRHGGKTSTFIWLVARTGILFCIMTYMFLQP